MRSTFLRDLSLPILAIAAGLLALLAIAPVAYADTRPAVEVAHPYRDTLIAQADVGSGSASTPAPAPAASPLDELADLKAKYDALRAAQKDKSPTLLLWAAMIATALKLLLSLFSKYIAKETKTWTKWVALGAAVPIALLSYFAGGASLFDSLMLAGAGPGAIIVHELLKRGDK